MCMADLPTRELGRTGLQVTMLGYGAMELRGALTVVTSPRRKRKRFSTPFSTPASIILIPRLTMD
jgi:hypothetical protein